MKISVIITNYNRKYELRRALESVYNQTICPYEVILVDDSDVQFIEDSKCAYTFKEGELERYLEQFEFPNLRYFRTEHRGPGGARNFGIERATGDYIAFLDSDNEWAPNRFEKVVDVIQRCPYIDVISMHYKYYEEFHWLIKPLDVRKDLLRDKWDPSQDQYLAFRIPLDRILIQDVSDASSTVYKADFLHNVGGFDEKFVTNIDWEIMLRARKMAISGKLHFIPILLDEALTDNHTMYDSLSEDIYNEFQEKMKLFRTVEHEIHDQNLVIDFYNQLQANKNIKMKTWEVNNLFFEACDDNKILCNIIQSLQQKVNVLENKNYKKNQYYTLLYKWMDIIEKGDSITNHLKQRKIRRVGIYGAGKHGELLYRDLCAGGIEVSFVADKNKHGRVEPFPKEILSFEDEWPSVDAVIVSVFLEMDQVRLSIEKKGCINVISLKQIIEQ